MTQPTQIDSTSSSSTVFIFGMTQRVGTNYLQRLMSRHPDCTNCPPIWEDYLLYASPHLVDFTNQVEKNWGPWKHKGPYKEELLECLGNGLISFLGYRAASRNHRLLTKTPSIKGLQYFPRLFPNARCVILIRDGRSVVSSLMAGFKREFKESCRTWTNAAEFLTSTRCDDSSFSKHHLIIRYEDLVSHTVDTLKIIFEYFSIESDDYDFDDIDETPIYGSSFFRGGEEKMHWKPVEISEDFRKMCRWQDWTDHHHKEFRKIAGKSMEALGYSLR